jgi:hypothetical protein
MKISQSPFHVRRWEHGDILNTQRCKDVFLQIFLQAETAHAHDQFASPVDVDAVLPFAARLVHERLSEDVS